MILADKEIVAVRKMHSHNIFFILRDYGPDATVVLKNKTYTTDSFITPSEAEFIKNELLKIN